MGARGLAQRLADLQRPHAAGFGLVLLDRLPQSDAVADAAPAADRPVRDAPLPAVRRRGRDRRLCARGALPDAAGSGRDGRLVGDQRALPAQSADRAARQCHACGSAALRLRGRGQSLRPVRPDGGEQLLRPHQLAVLQQQLPGASRHARGRQPRPPDRFGLAEFLVRLGPLRAATVDQRRQLPLRHRRRRHPHRHHALDPDVQRRQFVQLRAPDPAVRPRPGADAGAALPLRADAVSQPERAAALRHGAQGLQRSLDLQHQRIHRQRPHLGREPGDRGRLHPLQRCRQWPRVAAPGHRAEVPVQGSAADDVQFPGRQPAALSPQVVGLAAVRLVICDGALEFRRHCRAGSIPGE